MPPELESDFESVFSTDSDGEEKEDLTDEHTPDFIDDEPDNEEEAVVENPEKKFRAIESQREVEEQVPIITPEEKEGEYSQKTPEQRKEYIKAHAPKLSEEDYRYVGPDGIERRLDFTGVQTLDQLVKNINSLPYIENQKGEKIPSETLISLIYDRVLNRDDSLKDWTKITLRHGLREAVYRVTEDFMQEPEYKNLVGLNLDGITSVEEFKNALRMYGFRPNQFGLHVPVHHIISHIEKGNYNELPPSIAYKLAELLRKEEREKQTKQKSPIWQKPFSKIKSWFKRK